jgi:outer membrane biosynthesis protein TonB
MSNKEYRVGKPGMYFMSMGKLTEVPVGAKVRLRPESRAVKQKLVTAVEAEEEFQTDAPPAPEPKPAAPPAPEPKPAAPPAPEPKPAAPPAPKAK